MPPPRSLTWSRPGRRSRGASNDSFHRRRGGVKWMIGSLILGRGLSPQGPHDARAFECSPVQAPRWLPSRAAVARACWLGAGRRDRVTPAAPIASVWALMPHWSATGTATATARTVAPTRAIVAASTRPAVERLSAWAATARASRRRVVRDQVAPAPPAPTVPATTGSTAAPFTPAWPAAPASASTAARGSSLERDARPFRGPNRADAPGRLRCPRVNQGGLLSEPG
jgi:hypothetical protein